MVDTVTDNMKFNRVALEYSDLKESFTSEMLYDYILNHNIKFRKSMSKNRIGFNLATNPLFEKVGRKNNMNYYRKIKSLE